MPDVIAIDGYSATGKSTLAKQLAKRLGYMYVDSGAMFRAITYIAIDKAIVNTKTHSIDKSKLIALLSDINLTFGYNALSDCFDVFLNSRRISDHIRTVEVTQYVSAIAAIATVRHKVLQLQRATAQDHNIVMDGRDIGTAVFPDATFKLFMTADPLVRAQRRHQERIKRGESITLKAVYQSLMRRDRQDAQRAIAPLRKADDAIALDNTTMTIKEQLAWACALVSKV